MAVAAAAIIVALACGITIVTARPVDQRAVTPAVSGPTSLPASVDASRLVVAYGDVVAAQGRVVARANHRTLFCNTNVVVEGVGRPGQSGSDLCPGGARNRVAVVGIDMSRLSQRVGSRGTTVGTALVRGVLRAGVLHVAQQSPANTGPHARPEVVHFPCSAPLATSLPTAVRTRIDTGEQTSIEGAQRTYPGAILDLVIYRDRTHALVYVLTTSATATADVRSALRPIYGSALCVARSKYSLQDVERARAAFGFGSPATNPALADAGESSSSFGIGAAGDEQIRVFVARVTPALANLVHAQPAGLVVLDPWLVPAR